MPPPTKPNPYSSCHFRVEIDGIVGASFDEVSGIEADIAVIDYRAGQDEVAASRKLPGLVKFSNIVLKRGLTSDLSLWLWMQQTLRGDVVRKDLSVVLVNDSDEDVLRFNVKSAWPVKWSGPHFNAEGNDVATETLELTHEGLSVVA